ncbi:SRPBCC family protein [Nonomuraea sp. NPDC050394]|uniref:SRPBCC family protein n=1 Tax=Nonomuraea sp. NPDC050394 TaxID=3364363 RepID=UPI0037AE0063
MIWPSARPWWPHRPGLGHGSRPERAGLDAHDGRGGSIWKIQVGGVRREFDARITEQHPDERVAWESLDGPRHAGVVTFHRLNDDHTRVTLQMDTDPEGVAENVADAVGLLTHRVKGDLRRFGEFIEKRGGQTGAWRGEVNGPHQS